MNAVEIEEAVTALVESDFDSAEFPYAFLQAFGNKATTIKRLRSSTKSSSNKTDIAEEGVVSVLQRNHIHIATCEGGSDAVADLLQRLTDSDATQKHKAKFALATDGETVHAASLNSDDAPLVCEYSELGDRFSYFLELAGISTVRQIRENSFDIKATGRLNRLYVELLKHNPDWDGDERREDLNHFFARLIFCFFAEDTGIFLGSDLFTDTVQQMTEPSGENTHVIVAEIFRAMDVPSADRNAAELRSWANQFPYVNGGLFGGGTTIDDVPKFTQIARSYLLHIGSLDWTQINPDIFGSMIQAVADDEERGALGMHYTSVPNILKVLNPLFLDDLREKLDEAGNNARKLLNLRKRLARIRVFDPACGSGNFLVIAYKEMRNIEAEINRRRDEIDRTTEIPLTNFRGIELRHFAAEVARLALVIAEYQCDELHRGQRLALAEFLPLENNNWITHGNALRLDWLKVCPPQGTGVKLVEDDLFQTPLEQPEIDFENSGGETFICGNPPYYGSRRQNASQKEDLRLIASPRIQKWKSLDYISGWLLNAADYMRSTRARFAFVCTSSISEGLQVSLLWPHILGANAEIFFAHRPFRWANLANNNAGVSVVVIGVAVRPTNTSCRLFDGASVQYATHISAYLVQGADVYVSPAPQPIGTAERMITGSMPRDGGHLVLTHQQACELARTMPAANSYIRKYVGTNEIIKGLERYCLWIPDHSYEEVQAIPAINTRLKRVTQMREQSTLPSTNEFADRPHRFVYLAGESKAQTIAVGGVSSEGRPYLPVDLLPPRTVVSNLALAIYDGTLVSFSIIASRLHLVWIAAVCGKLETRYRYSNTLGWNTFPVPDLTDQNKADLTTCAENILLARESHWPATIAELYAPEKMPDNLRAAHDRNDENLERIYIGRRFKNDTERLETLFRMYTEMDNQQ